MARKSRTGGRTRKARQPARKPQTASWLDHGWLLVAFLLAPLILRAALLAERDIGFGLPDLRGFFSDLTVSLSLAVVAGLSLRWTRWLTPLLAVLWALISSPEYQTY